MARAEIGNIFHCFLGGIEANKNFFRDFLTFSNIIKNRIILSNLCGLLKKTHLYLFISLQCFFQATGLKLQTYVPKLDKDLYYVLIILTIIFQVPNHRSFGIPSVVKRT